MSQPQFSDQGDLGTCSKIDSTAILGVETILAYIAV
jgi:hypothetical protein